MDCEQFGALVRSLREERGMTQREVADVLGVTDKAVSKWERGLCCPDISLLRELAGLLRVDIDRLLSGELPDQSRIGDSMRNIKFFVCPECGGISTALGDSRVSCCGRPLDPLEAVKADDAHRLTVETVEDDWFVSSGHEMSKEHHIAFVAFVKGDSMTMFRTYPEWEMQVRIPRRGHGKLFSYCTQHGLSYTLI